MCSHCISMRIFSTIIPSCSLTCSIPHLRYFTQKGFFFVIYTGVWIQGSLFASQVLYQKCALVILGTDSPDFLPRSAWTGILLFYASTPAGMTGMYQHTHLFSIEMESYKLFCWGLSGRTVILITASHTVQEDKSTPLCQLLVEISQMIFLA